MNSFERWFFRYDKRSGWNTKDDCKAAYIAGLEKASRLAALKEYPVKAILDEIEKISELSDSMPKIYGR